MPGDSAVTGQAVGFACAWGPDESETWSGTPFRLRAALAKSGPLVNLGVELPRGIQLALKAASARYADGHWVSMWKHGRIARELTTRRLATKAEQAGCDAIVMIQDLGVLPMPYLIVQDLSYDALLDHFGDAGVPHFPGLDRAGIEKMRDRQLEVYEDATALLPMSHWLADRLAKSGVPKSKIFPVHPGVNVPVEIDQPAPQRRISAARKLLFIGKDPRTKALDLVVAAFIALRRELGPALTLTVAGPPAWPLPGEVPDGVSYLGPISRARVAELMDSHDLFVMPSRLEGFGIAFVEALSRGLPCIGRNDFAMPEIIQPGTGGALIDGDDPGMLAAVIAATLADDELYHRCAANVGQIREHYTWSRAARQIRDVVGAIGPSAGG